MKPADIVYLTWQCSYGVGKWESSNYDVPFFFFFPPATALSDSTLHSLKFLPQLYTTTDSSQTGTKSVTDYTWEFLSLSIIFKPCCVLINFEHELPAPPLPRSNQAQTKCCWCVPTGNHTSQRLQTYLIFPNREKCSELDLAYYIYH